MPELQPKPAQGSPSTVSLPEAAAAARREITALDTNRDLMISFDEFSRLNFPGKPQSETELRGLFSELTKASAEPGKPPFETLTELDLDLLSRAPALRIPEPEEVRQFFEKNKETFAQIGRGQREAAELYAELRLVRDQFEREGTTENDRKYLANLIERERRVSKQVSELAESLRADYTALTGDTGVSEINGRETFSIDFSQENRPGTPAGKYDPMPVFTVGYHQASSNARQITIDATNGELIEVGYRQAVERLNGPRP